MKERRIVVGSVLKLPSSVRSGRGIIGFAKAREGAGAEVELACLQVKKEKEGILLKETW